MDKKIVVMHFVSGLLSGGVEQVIYNYCKFMNHERFEFIVVYQHNAVTGCMDKIQSIPCKTIRITARNENFIKNIIDSYKVIDKFKPDIVHTHMNLMNFCALIPAKLQKVKVRICHSHIAETKRNTLYNIAACFFKFLNIKSASNLIACGKEAGKFMYGSNKMIKGEVEVLENAIDLELFERDQKARKKIREQLKCDKETLLIGNIGRFTKQKNQKRLLEIFSEIKKENSKTKLVLVGTGELLGQCEKLSGKLSIADSVVFYGTTNNIREIYSALDIFVLPSLYEGFPVVAIEVQAAKVPAVFSDTIAESSKLTDFIEFVPLQESNKLWATKILSKSNFNRNIDTSKLSMKYDIRNKAKNLEDYYLNALLRDSVR